MRFFRLRSRRMSVLSLRLTLVAALLVGAAAFTVVAFAPADAEAACWGVTSYYSDATYTEVVGARGTGCCGEPVNWGIITPYSKCHRIYCLDVICPQFE